MAAGQRNLSFSEKHHLFSDKNKKYTPLYQKTFDKYGVSLNDSKNIVPVDGHRGRHSNTYHQMMLFAINMLDGVADGNCDIFTNGLDELGVYIQQNWWMPYIK